MPEQRIVSPSRRLPRILKEHLPGILTIPASPQATETIVKLAHKLAVAGLISKRNIGHLCNLQGLTIQDLAYDCIAELFQEGASGAYIQIRTYFSGIDIEATEEEQLLVLFRRLILGKVSNGVFRMYNEIDPPLGRILRNIKLGIASLRNFDEVERFGDPCVVPTVCDHLMHLPPPELEDLVAGLRQIVSGSKRVPDLLSALSMYLRTQEVHSRIVPILLIALAFRDLYMQNRTGQEELIQPSATYLQTERENALHAASVFIQREYSTSYLGTRKLDKDTWDAYFTVIEMNLHKKFIQNDGDNFSLSVGMQQMVPGLTIEKYRKEHRARLEHLHRLVKRKFLATVKQQ